MASQPSLRIGDREREAVAAELREHYAHGRLSLEEFNQRLDQVFASKTQAELSQVTFDLPHVRSAGAALPASRAGSGGGASRARFSAPGPASAGQQARTAGAGWNAGNGWTGGAGWNAGNGWTGAGSGAYPARSVSYGRGGRRPRSGFAALSTLIAALVSVLIVVEVMAGLSIPVFGRVGILVAIFTVLRGILRRVFGGGRKVHRSGRKRR